MKNITLLLGCFSIFCACRPQVIDVKLPDVTPKLVVHALWNDGDTVLWAWVGSNTGLLSNVILDSAWSNPYHDYTKPYSETEWINNATVEVYKNGNLLGTMQKDDSSRTYQLPIAQPLINDNATYELRVSAPTYSSVIAHQSTSAAPIMSNLSYSRESARDIDGEKLDVVEFNLQDNSNTENYYVVGIWLNARDTSWGTPDDRGYYPQLSSPDPNLETSSIGLSFSDTYLNNANYKVTLHVYPIDTAYFSADVRLFSVSKEHYQFYKALQKHDNTDGNPFAEPVVLYTNITNGYGLFSVQTHQEFVLIP